MRRRSSASGRVCSYRRSPPRQRSPGSGPTAPKPSSAARSYAEAQERCDAYVAESGALPIHPYDATETIAGAGTVALEWEEDLARLGLPALDTVACRGRRRRADRGRRRLVRRPGQGRRRRAGGFARAACRARGRRGRSMSQCKSIAADSLGARRVGDLNFAIARKFCRRGRAGFRRGDRRSAAPSLERGLDRRRAGRRGGLRRARERRLSAGEGRARRRPRLRRERRPGGVRQAAVKARGVHGDCDKNQRAAIASAESPNYCPPAFRRAGSGPAAIGASPSGKAADFDSAMPRFESSRPSQLRL